MPHVAVRSADLTEIASLRDQYRGEMNCQIIHDSIHERPGWTREYILEIDATAVGYGSVAVEGPWRDTPTLYEFYVERAYRTRIFDSFDALLERCEVKAVETQSNDPLLTVMLHTFARSVRTESILFEDRFETSFAPAGTSLRAAHADDAQTLRSLDLDDGAAWVLTLDGEIAGAGGVLYHYNPPYGDVYMKIAETHRRKGLGAYLVQELKTVCRANGCVPAARCGVDNLASRKALQKAGFVPCGNILVGDLAK